MRQRHAPAAPKLGRQGHLSPAVTGQLGSWRLGCRDDALKGNFNLGRRDFDLDLQLRQRSGRIVILLWGQSEMPKKQSL